MENCRSKLDTVTDYGIIGVVSNGELTLLCTSECETSEN